MCPATNEDGARAVASTQTLGTPRTAVVVVVAAAVRPGWRALSHFFFFFFASSSPRAGQLKGEGEAAAVRALRACAARERRPNETTAAQVRCYA